MNRILCIRTTLALSLTVAALHTGAAFALEVQMPPETAAYKPSSLPGYQLTLRDCMTCHSAHYVQSQPSSSPRAYWEATVKKMKHPFGAQFADEDIAPIADYLVKTYGAERDTVSATPVAIKAADKAEVSKTVVAKAAVAKAEVSKPEVAKAEVSKPAADKTAVIDVQALMTANGCTACHAVNQKIVGPAFKEVAAKYAKLPDALTQVTHNIRAGGVGRWGAIPMPPFSGLSEAEAQALARYVLAQ